MGQPTEQSRDDFKDVQEVEVLSYKNFQKKFCGEAFFGMSSLKTQLIEMLKRDHFSCFGGWTHLGQRTKLDSKVEYNIKCDILKKVENRNQEGFITNKKQVSIYIDSDKIQKIIQKCCSVSSLREKRGIEIYAWKLKSNWKEDNGNHKVIKIEFKYVIRLNFIMVLILTKWILIGFCFRKMSKHCKFYLQGNCKNGRNCSFFHQEIRRDRYGMLSKTFQTNPRRDETSKESKRVNERCIVLNFLKGKK